MPFPCDKEVYLARITLSEEQSKEGNLVLGHSRSLQFSPDVNTQIILGLYNTDFNNIHLLQKVFANDCYAK